MIINKERDGNTLLDVCDDPIAENSAVAFDFVTPQPILAVVLQKLPVLLIR